ncbi:hypothetical protein C0995_011109, partial [Termitomyces sp. Mi166
MSGRPTRNKPFVLVPAAKYKKRRRDHDADVGPGRSVAAAINAATGSDAVATRPTTADAQPSVAPVHSPGSPSSSPSDSENEEPLFAVLKHQKLVDSRSKATSTSDPTPAPVPSKSTLARRARRRRSLGQNVVSLGDSGIGYHSLPNPDPNAVAPPIGTQHVFPKVNAGRVDRSRFRQDHQLNLARSRNRKFFGKAIAPISIQRADATLRLGSSTKELISEQAKDESDARRRAYEESRCVYLAVITPDIATSCALPSDKDGVYCEGCGSKKNPIKEKRFHQDKPFQKEKRSRKMENAHRRDLVQEKCHPLPWGSVVWIRLEPRKLLGRVSYKEINNGGEKPEFTWTASAYGTEPHCTSEKFRSNMVHSVEDHQLYYRFILDPYISRMSFAGIVHDLIIASQNVMTHWWNSHNASKAIQDLVFSRPPFWNYTEETFKKNPFTIPHPVFTPFIKSASAGDGLWFVEPFADYVQQTFPILDYPGLKYIYGALLLLTNGPQDFEDIDTLCQPGYEAYKKIAEDFHLAGFDAAKTLE